MIVNVAAFLASAMSSVVLDSRGQLLDIQNGIILCFFHGTCTYWAKRGLSWFSKKFPRRVESLQVDFTVLIMLYRSVMLPEVDWKALRSG
jgi:hypothetical protein